MYELTTSINNKVLNWSEYCMNKENPMKFLPQLYTGVLGHNAEWISQGDGLRWLWSLWGRAQEGLSEPKGTWDFRLRQDLSLNSSSFAASVW